MRKEFKGLSIFSKLLLYLAGFSFAITLVTGFIYYRHISQAVRSSIDKEVKNTLETVVKELNEQKNHMEGYLKYLESSAYVDRLLSAQESEIFLYRPDVERQFMKFGNSTESIIKLHLLDLKGEERVAVEGNKRIRNYVSLNITDKKEKGVYFQKMAALFKALRSQPPLTIIFIGPLKAPDGKPTFFAGISKLDPDTGGFGGVIMAHIDLRHYLERISNFKVLGKSVIWVFDAEGNVLLSPPDRTTSIDSRAYFNNEWSNGGSQFFYSETIKFDSDSQNFLEIVLRVPPEMYSSPMRGIVRQTLVISFMVMIFSMLVALVISRKFSNPINDLVRASLEIGKGNLLAKASLTTGGEIGLLSKSFNEMVENLNATTVSRDYVDNIIGSMLDMLIVLSPDKTITRVNHAVCNLLGYDKNELVGQPVGNILGDSTSFDELECGGAITSKIRGINENTIVTKDGREIPVLLSISKMCNDKEKMEGIVCVVQDITERKRAENALQKAHDELEERVEERTKELSYEVDIRKSVEVALQKQTRDIKLLYEVFSQSREAVSVNEVLQVCTNLVCELTQWPVGHVYLRDEKSGSLNSSAIWYLKSDERYADFRVITEQTSCEEGIGLPGRIVESGKASWIVDVQKDDNFPRINSCEAINVRGAFGFPIEVNGEIVAVFEFFSDDEMLPDLSLLKTLDALGNQIGQIIEKKKSDEELNVLSSVVKQSPVSILITDLEGKIEYVNPKFTRLTGYAEEIVGQTPRILKSGKMKREEYKELWETITSGKEWQGELCNRKKNGEYYWEFGSISPIRNNEGVITNFIKVAEDITGKKLMEEREKLRSLELENLVESLNKLVEELQLNVQEAKQLLDFVHGEQPRYIDTDELTIFSHVISLPCSAEGGDHYFVQKTDGNKTLISLKDQSGHSVGCLLRSIMTDIFYKSLINNEKHQNLEKFLDKLNSNMYRAGLFNDDEFFTSLDVEIDNKSLNMRYASGGHPPFILIRGNHILTLPVEGGKGQNPPLAIFDDTVFSAGEYQLTCGDKLIFYTDGLTEATIKDGKNSISMKEMIKIVSRDVTLPVSDIMNNIVYEVAEKCGERIDPLKKENSSKDDITLLGVEIENRNAYHEEIWEPKSKEDLDCLYGALLKRLLKEWDAKGFEQEHRLTYILAESLVNAYTHGNKGDKNKSIYIRWRWGNDLHYEVIDEGAGFDYKNLPDPTLPESVEHSSGRGIFIMRHFANHLSWRDSGRHLKAVFEKHPEQNKEENVACVNEYIDLWRKDDSLFEDIRLV